VEYIIVSIKQYMVIGKLEKEIVDGIPTGNFILISPAIVQQSNPTTDTHQFLLFPGLPKVIHLSKGFMEQTFWYDVSPGGLRNSYIEVTSSLKITNKMPQPLPFGGGKRQ
jgi:hypothetical protein